MVKLSVVISYYKALDKLKLILLALEKQTSFNFEVILSEDDFNQETINFTKTYKSTAPFKFKHIYQTEDNGFKKNIMLNRAIKSSESNKLVFIDGDCIPHKKFVEEYSIHIDEKTFLAGRSVMLGPKITNKINSDKSLKALNIISILLSDSTKKKEGLYSPYFPLSSQARGLVGRNWGVSKQRLIELNGFDEDYKHAGIGEDVDIEWRMIAHGLKRKSIKNKAIVYHLYHKRWYSSEKERENYKMMHKKVAEGRSICQNGIEK